MFFDTHVLVWMLGERHRLSVAARAAMSNPDQPWYISAVVAWEFSDLATRGRLGPVGTLGEVLDRFEMDVLPFPADAWRLLASLPAHHRDPVDRMLIAHALLEDMTLLTADTKIPLYPVRTIW